MRTRTTLLGTIIALVGISTSGSAWAQSELRSGRFSSSDGVDLHYLEAGSGPALVFVPGFTMPAEIWEPQLRHFAASHRVIALDPRSQGRSQKATEGHYLARRGQDIGELIAHLGAAPAIVVGWSSGVLELLTYVQEFGTAALRAVVLVDMFIGVDQEPGQLHPFAPLWTTWINEIQVNRQAWTREWVRSMYRSEQREEYLAAITEAVLATPTNTAVTLLTNLMFMGPTDLRPALDALDRPVLYVVTSRDRAEIVRARRADVRIAVLDNAGHALFVDEADRFNRLLEEFFATLPEY
jgi:non-heme chloroperoxidase